jgi:2-polyprenyl-3-methyl-5-hydroxy-6-metoxy-1,4-benzoquinol methylase
MGNVQTMLDIVEGISFQSSPLDLFILLARYKFAARLIDQNDDVLDAGCGHGLGSVMLAKFCRSVTAVDIDPELIEDCQVKYAGVKNLHFETADLKRLDSLGRKYDAIVCMDVIEHFPQKEGREILKKFSGLLDERGLLVVGTPNVRSAEFASERRKQTHEFEYDYETFRDLLKETFGRAMVFSSTDEVVSTGFSEMAWYFLGVCVR